MNQFRNRTLSLLASALLLSCSSRLGDKRKPARTLPLIAKPVSALEKSFEASGSEVAFSAQADEANAAMKKILDRGGNLADATVAGAFVLAVVRPQSTSLGGGGFMLYRDGKTGNVHAIDFRERAPAKANAEMFLDAAGGVVKGMTLDTPQSSAVPGYVGGLYEIYQKLGSKKIKWATLLEDAIWFASKGVTVSEHLGNSIEMRKAVIAKYPSSRKIFFHPNGDPLKSGDMLVQKDLAKTLQTVAASPKAFFTGTIAKTMDRVMRANGGLITAKDLAAYRSYWVEPLATNFNGYRILTMPPPSSGGVHVIQILNMLANEKMETRSPGSAENIHLWAQASQQAYSDRAAYMGDPRFVPVPVAELISPELATRQRALFLKRARRAIEVRPSPIDTKKRESRDTTQISVINKAGDMVSMTLSLNFRLGSTFVVEGTGIVMNDTMDDFSAKPGTLNVTGAVGGDTNSIQPGKTPLSSMSPTLVLKDEKPFLAVGGPGGAKIITCVAQTLFNVLVYNMPLYEAVATVRYHHQWKPDELLLDPPGPSQETLERLKKLGYNAKVEPIACWTFAASSVGGQLRAVADPRDSTSSASAF